jgi:hypothetical protein
MTNRKVSAVKSEYGSKKIQQYRSASVRCSYRVSRITCRAMRIGGLAQKRESVKGLERAFWGCGYAARFGCVERRSFVLAATDRRFTLRVAKPINENYEER